MGSSTSKSSSSSNPKNVGIKIDEEEQVYFNIQHPVQLHQSLIDRVSLIPCLMPSKHQTDHSHFRFFGGLIIFFVAFDQLSEPSSSPTSSRQIALDESVQQKLQSDLKNLKLIETELENKLSKALSDDQENLTKDGHTSSSSSAQLFDDLSSLKAKAHQFKQRNSSSIGKLPEINSARSAIVSCLLSVIFCFCFCK